MVVLESSSDGGSESGEDDSASAGDELSGFDVESSEGEAEAVAGAAQGEAAAAAPDAWAAQAAQAAAKAEEEGWQLRYLQEDQTLVSDSGSDGDENEARSGRGAARSRSHSVVSSASTSRARARGVAGLFGGSAGAGPGNAPEGSSSSSSAPAPGLAPAQAPASAPAWAPAPAASRADSPRRKRPLSQVSELVPAHPATVRRRRDERRAADSPVRRAAEPRAEVAAASGSLSRWEAADALISLADRVELEGGGDFNAMVLRAYLRSLRGQGETLEAVPTTFGTLEDVRATLRPLIAAEALAELREGLLALHHGRVAGRFEPTLEVVSKRSGDGRCSISCKVRSGGDGTYKDYMPSTLYALQAQGGSGGGGGALLLVGLVSRGGGGAAALELDVRPSFEQWERVMPGTKFRGMVGPSLVSLERMHAAKVKEGKLPFEHVLLRGREQGAHHLFGSDSEGEPWDARRASKSTRAGKAEEEHQVLQERGLAHLQQLNSSQRDAVLSALKPESAGVHLWQGPPGSGKTRTITAFLEVLVRRRGGTGSASAADGAASAAAAAAVTRTAVAAAAGEEHEQGREQQQRAMVAGPSNQSVQLLLERLIERCREQGLELPPVALAAVLDATPQRLDRYFCHRVLAFVVAELRAALEDVQERRYSAVDRAIAALAIVRDRMPGTWKRAVKTEVAQSLAQMSQLRQVAASFARSAAASRRSAGSSEDSDDSSDGDSDDSSSTGSNDESTDGSSGGVVVGGGGSSTSASTSTSGNPNPRLRSGKSPAARYFSLAGGAITLWAERVEVVARDDAQAPQAELEFVQTAELVFCTLAVSGRKSVIRATKERRLDFLVVDEACQSVEAETWVALQCRPRRLVLVGDPRQLSSTVLSRAAASAGFQRPLMERLMMSGHAYVMLDTQYRMHPDISSFPSRRYYNSLLKDGANVSTRPPLFTRHGHVCFFDVADGAESRERAGSSIANAREADEVTALLQEISGAGVEPRTDAIVITFYSAQVDEIKRRLKQRGLGSVPVATVDSFQGSESNIVLLSFVRCNAAGDVGFLRDARRLNVAITRAKHCLFMFGSLATLERSGNEDLLQLVAHLKERNHIKAGELRSTPEPPIGLPDASELRHTQRRQHQQRPQYQHAQRQAPPQQYHRQPPPQQHQQQAQATNTPYNRNRRGGRRHQRKARERREAAAAAGGAAAQHPGRAPPPPVSR